MSGKTTRGKSYRIEGRLSLQELIARTRCKLCRQKGHWARECPQRGGKAAGKGSSPAASGRTEEHKEAKPTFFVYWAAEDNEAEDAAKDVACYRAGSEGRATYAGFGVVDTGCTRFLIGQGTACRS